MDVVHALKSSAPFSHLTPAELEALARSLSPLKVPGGAEIVRQDDSTRDAYLLAGGSVKIQRDTPYGRYDLASLGAGDLFGEASFIDLLGRSGDVLTETECDLLLFSPESLAPVLDADPRLNLALHWAFWKSLSDKLRRANQHLLAFFADPGQRPDHPSAYAKSPTGSFQIGLAQKKQLFEEQKLTPMEINFLATLSKAKQLPAGEIVFREGEPGDRMYIVLDGQVMISKQIPGVGEEALAFLTRGDYFGEMALIDNLPRSADAKAHAGGAVVLAISSDVLSGILDIGKVSSLRLLKLLCSLIAKRLREIDEKIVGWFMLGGGSPPEGLP